MDQSSAASNRRTRRSNVLLAASIVADGAVTAVKLRNLSDEGALIEGDSLPAEGALVLFQRNELSVAGRVAWIRGRQAGIAFAEQLQPQEVLRNIPRPAAKPTPEFRRPGLACRPLSPQERRFIHHWVWSPPRSPVGD